MADDLDIAPDGKIYFSDCTTRYEMTTNALDIIEGRPERPAGGATIRRPARPQTLIKHFYFPNGICVSHDGRSVLIASTTLAVYRYWIAGPQTGNRNR